MGKQKRLKREKGLRFREGRYMSREEADDIDAKLRAEREERDQMRREQQDALHT